MGTQVNRAGGRGVEIWRGVDGNSLVDNFDGAEHLGYWLILTGYECWWVVIR